MSITISLQVERLRSMAEVSLIFFYAPWCAHSMAARQEVQQVAKKLAKQVTGQPRADLFKYKILCGKTSVSTKLTEDQQFEVEEIYLMYLTGYNL